jgi:hypothetical protein
MAQKCHAFFEWHLIVRETDSGCFYRHHLKISLIIRKFCREMKSFAKVQKKTWINITNLMAQSPIALVVIL